MDLGGVEVHRTGRHQERVKRSVSDNPALLWGLTMLGHVRCTRVHALVEHLRELEQAERRIARDLLAVADVVVA